MQKRTGAAAGGGQITVQPDAVRTPTWGATYQRIAARRGSKKAAIAAGRSILEIAYFVLRDGVAYQDLGVSYDDERKKDAVVRNTVKRLERLGYRVLSNRQPKPTRRRWADDIFGGDHV